MSTGIWLVVFGAFFVLGLLFIGLVEGAIERKARVIADIQRRIDELREDGAA